MSRLAAVDIGRNPVRLLVADVDGAGPHAELKPLDAAGAPVPYPRLSLEEVVRQDPQVILFPVGDDEVIPDQEQQRWLRWTTLSAVRQNRFVRIPSVLLDRPGCGLSEPLQGRLDGDGLREVATSLSVDVLDALGLESAAVVATSYGGFAALHGAAAHPDRIRQVVHFGWPVGAPVARVPMAMRMAAIQPVARLMAAMPPTKGSVRSMLRRVGLRRAIDTGRFGEQELAWFLALLRDTDTFRNELRAGRYLSLRHGLLGDLIIPDEVLASIRTPVYFLWGEGDPFGGEEIARRLVDRLPNAELELLPEAGHAVWIDEPDHAAAVVTRLLGAPEGEEGSASGSADAGKA